VGSSASPIRRSVIQSTSNVPAQLSMKVCSTTLAAPSGTK
jgi:hypothetical protein